MSYASRFNYKGPLVHEASELRWVHVEGIKVIQRHSRHSRETSTVTLTLSTVMEVRQLVEWIWKEESLH